MEFRIDLRDLEFYAIIGILPQERKMQQKIIVDLWLTYEYAQGFVDYAKVADLIKKHMQKEQFELLEDALISCANLIKESFPQIKNLSIAIKKPQILHNATPSVSLFLKFE
ncbi:dihydroneopterin aldolase [Nitratiruptor tergarcus]|uniref:dihydroneopterin aldolase n=1 Tax=Nitratiruptor tergarcus DSM 16512 TaxID=1069081 RepID=A0A1W1WSA7_9BACT|nr:dihydroneopterin aldolase [Nitratiruptor tergarcus]SMC09089.1 dihydroneopterin aldolase [Nitratiruptor tergarcus DSM 16512]